MMRDRYVILILIILTLAITLPGIKGSLPSLTVSDEFQIVERALYCGTGDLNPHLFTWPAQLPVYLLFGLFGILYIFLHILQKVGSTQDFMLLYLQNPTLFYITARIFSTIITSISIIFLYPLVKKLSNKTTAIFSSIVLITSPLFIKTEVVAKPEPYLLLFTILVLYFIYREEKIKTIDVVLSAIFTSASISSKYNALLILPSIILIILIKKDSKTTKLKHLGLFIATTILFFIIFSPFMLIDYQSAINDIKSQFARAGEVPFNIKSSIYWLSVNLTPRIITFVLIPFFIFGIYLISRRKHLLPLSLIVFLNIISIIGRYVPPHYLIVSLPSIAISSGFGLNAFISYIKRAGKIMTIIILLIIIALILIPTLKIEKNSTLIDTREIARRWIEENIKSDSSILVDRIIPDVESPQIIPNAESARVLVNLGMGAVRFKILTNESIIINNRTRFDLHPLSMDGNDIYGFIKDSQIEYIITSIFNDKDFYVDQCLDFGVETYPGEYKYHKMLNERFILIKEFLPDGKISKGPEVLIYKTR